MQIKQYHKLSDVLESLLSNASVLDAHQANSSQIDLEHLEEFGYRPAPNPHHSMRCEKTNTKTANVQLTSKTNTT